MFLPKSSGTIGPKDSAFGPTGGTIGRPRVDCRGEESSAAFNIALDLPFVKLTTRRD
jgi:hypothetical protein